MKGFVLLSTLLFISLLSLIVLSNSQLFVMQIKALAHIKEDLEQSVDLERVMVKVIDLIKSKTINLQPYYTDRLMLKKHTFAYDLQALGIDQQICWRAGEVMLATSHWQVRVTDGQKMLIVRLALPVLSEKCGPHAKRVIHANILSWNEVNQKVLTL
ncbi:MAG: hypothetical protein CMF38_01145 [Legionellaceae bacterium]|nr:hypothetical protein [Legionellaceae bacterium]HAF87887.1 hypothetical protein [Legionellales bacterium]HCA89363.1 hypothetical protein [Legionellales bacterium]|tara:strand:- start:1424 stop:1894 length:471 start_codon:yes stop_codon:yes gene_type:complete